MASGDTLLVFIPQGAEFPTVDYGRTDQTAFNHPITDLAVDENVRFSGVMPRHYAGGGVTIYLHYAMSSATGDDIELQTAFERIGDQQQNIHTGDGFTTAQASAETTVPGTAGLVDIITTTHTSGAQMDGLLAGEGFRLNVERVAVSGTEASGDLELRFVEIRETP